MKKSILVIAIALFGFTTVSAQEFVRFGAKGGLNFSNFAGDGFASFEDDSNARTSFHLGLMAEVPVSDIFSVQPEVLYSSQGFDIVQVEDGADVEYKLDYITVPIMAKVNVFNGLGLVAGPQLGFMVDEDIDYGDTDVDISDDNLNKFDFSLGLGAEFNLGNLAIYGRYNAGMTDIYDVEGVDAKNSVIQVGVGLLF